MIMPWLHAHFAFWVDDETTTGKNIIKKILNTPGYPKNAVVMGYGMHGDDLNLTTNPEGFGFVVSDLFPRMPVIILRSLPKHLRGVSRKVWLLMRKRIKYMSHCIG